jgi:hypothetical protein
MTLTPGTCLGPYEIITLLGAGGRASARAGMRELRRGLARAKLRRM